MGKKFIPLCVLCMLVPLAACRGKAIPQAAAPTSSTVAKRTTTTPKPTTPKPKTTTTLMAGFDANTTVQWCGIGASVYTILAKLRRGSLNGKTGAAPQLVAIQTAAADLAKEVTADAQSKVQQFVADLDAFRLYILAHDFAAADATAASLYQKIETDTARLPGGCTF